MAHKEFTFAGFGVRWLVALLLVFASYNPEGFSYFHWLLNTQSSTWAVKVFVGVVLLIGWTVYLRATFSSLGGLGIFLAMAFFASLLWVLIYWGWVPTDSIRAVSYIVLFIIAALLAIGMSWSHLRRRASGQIDVDEIEER
jgi:Family of unknown function (DUF6524)